MSDIRPIDANALKSKILYEDVNNVGAETWSELLDRVIYLIDNAPTVEYPFYAEAYQTGYEEGKNDRQKGEYLDISKLRLMTVEECAGHTIDYALGWKACIEWIKKGGAEE